VDSLFTCHVVDWRRIPPNWLEVNYFLCIVYENVLFRTLKIDAYTCGISCQYLLLSRGETKGLWVPYVIYIYIKKKKKINLVNQFGIVAGTRALTENLFGV
jgi:hypothetical protein